MTLPLPNLDDRRWADLVEEGRALIPVYAPEWTDHNVSDPGITLVDLLAWIAEMDVFRANQVPARHRRKFLSLVGIRPRPPQPSRTILRLALASNATMDRLSLPAGLDLIGQIRGGDPVPFRTAESVTVTRASLEAVQMRNGGGFADLTERWRRGEAFTPFGDDPKPGDALYLGFSGGLPVGSPTSLWFVIGDEAGSADTRRRLADEAAARALACARPEPDCEPVECGEDSTQTSARRWGVAVPAVAPAGGFPAAVGDAIAMLEHHSVRTVWEMAVAGGDWLRLDPAVGEVLDDTRAFTLNGRVLVTPPVAMAQRALGIHRADLHYLRCRVVSGAFDAAPTVTALVPNGVKVEQAAPTCVESKGTGWPLQELLLPGGAVIVSSVRIMTTEDSSTATEWHQQADFDASGPGDRHFTLDATSGLVTFGDGQNGAVVSEGEVIRADYLATQADAGNLAAGAAWSVLDTPANRATFRQHAAGHSASAGTWAQVMGLPDQAIMIDQPLAASGGAAAETRASAEARAFALRSETGRAVTLRDYEELVLNTPGVGVARANARANRHPGFPCLRADGMVTLVVLPYLPQRRPSPSAGLLRAVAGYLARRRTIGTRVEVVGPDYLPVTVRAIVRALPTASMVEVRRRAVVALDEFFLPLDGGPGGDGWPLGRDVYRSEVMRVLDQVDGVDHVLSLELVAGDGPPTCGNVCLGPLSLVAAGDHQIEVRR